MTLIAERVENITRDHDGENIASLKAEFFSF